MIRLAVVEAHPLVRLGIEHYFAGHTDITVVASLDRAMWMRGAAAVADVLLVDPGPIAEGTGGEPRARWCRATRVLVMRHTPAPVDVAAAARAGAYGLLGKDACPARFLTAVREVAAGRCAWDATVPAGPVQTLSARARAVLRDVATGLTHRQIATRHAVAHSTVDTYVKRIRGKLGLGNKAALTRAALEHGLLTGDSNTRSV